MDYQNNFKQFLKGTGKTVIEDEDSITKKEMMELQEAIDKSKETAEEGSGKLNQAEEIQEHFYKNNSEPGSSNTASKEKPFTARQWTKPPKSPIAVATLEKESSSTQKEYEITFQDLLETSEKPLDIIHHKPIFDLPIPTNPEYKKYSVQERANMLSDYFTKLSDSRTKLARQSVHRAPSPKPILLSTKCINYFSKNGLDSENGNFDELVDQIPVEEVYVSRAGRQIKRKIYTEENENDSDPDFQFSVKKNKSDNSDTKITLDDTYVPEENHEEKRKIPKIKKDTSRRSLPLAKKANSRSDTLFEKLVHEDEKRRQQDLKTKNFEKTLLSLEESEEFLLNDNIKETQIEEGKKLGKPKKTQITEERAKTSEILQGSPPGSPILRRYYPGRNIHTEPKPAQKLKDIPSSLEQSVAASIKKTNCPICSRKFLLCEIEDHAATCGIEDELDDFQNARNEPLKQIRCELCDRYLPMNTAYEVHVKQCIGATISDL